MAVQKIPTFIFPEPPTHVEGEELPEALKAWAGHLHKEMQSQLDLLTARFNEVADGNYGRLRFIPQATEPAEPEEGHVTFADGAGFDPGAGAGLYEYRSGTWNKI